MLGGWFGQKNSNLFSKFPSLMYAKAAAGICPWHFTYAAAFSSHWIKCTHMQLPHRLQSPNHLQCITVYLFPFRWVQLRWLELTQSLSSGPLNLVRLFKPKEGCCCVGEKCLHCSLGDFIRIRCRAYESLWRKIFFSKKIVWRFKGTNLFHLERFIQLCFKVRPSIKFHTERKNFLSKKFGQWLKI